LIRKENRRNERFKNQSINPSFYLLSKLWLKRPKKPLLSESPLLEESFLELLTAGVAAET
jgi:hypothetical protein